MDPDRKTVIFVAVIAAVTAILVILDTLMAL
jgi:preprotein translocase subunit SecE